MRVRKLLLWIALVASLSAPHGAVAQVGTPGLLQGMGVHGSNGTTGNDTIYGYGSLNGNSGNDKIYCTAACTVNDGSGNDFVIGSGQTDTFTSSAGNDILVHSPGNDTITGGAGADIFQYNNPNQGGVDTITDFLSSTGVFGDKISILSSAFGGVNAGNLVITNGAGIANITESTTDPQFLYDQSTDGLYYDANGSTNGTADAVELAILQHVATLHSYDFQFR